MPETIERPRGLSSAEVQERRARYGENALDAGRRASPLRVLARQFSSLLVVILIVAAGIAILIGERVDAAAILLVVGLNGILGFVQEWRSETAIEALRSLMAPSARVVRDGEERLVPARELVPGDVVILEAGDRVPADIEATATSACRADESVLTGESVPVDKSVSGDRRLYMGSSLAAGRAEGVVTAISGETEFGRIAALTGSVGEKVTHLQVALSRLAGRLGLVALGLAALVVAIGLASGRDLVAMLMTGLSLAVAMVPEGLPAVVTVTLALGAQAMARHNAVARRLQAVETLGAASVICTDKTGTLTESKMTVTRLWTPWAEYQVTGSGYDPAGQIARGGRRVRAADDPGLAAVLRVALACNHARISRGEEGWTMLGEPTEGALVTLAYKGWAELDGAVVAERPFDSERKRMSVVLRRRDRHTLLVKGAPEAVLEVAARQRSADGEAALDAAARARIEQAFAAMAEDGLRVIALAERELPAPEGEERELTFLGLAGLIDPPRPEVAAAIETAGAAGIRTIMVTGDGPATAAAIAESLGLGRGAVLTGEDLRTMGDEALGRVVAGDVLFARTAPGQKMRIVESLQAQGEVVAMTGDGVNDAPALRRADIGVAMGRRGTDVAKDAADLVLLDDNFATIVGAIREGRRQFDNVRKFVLYLLASNAAEVLAIIVSLLVGGPLIFLATQILWINLVTDSASAVALGLEPAEEDQMRRPPRPRDERIVTAGGLPLIAAFALYTGGASLAIFYSLLPEGEAVARTAAFTAMVVFENVSVFAFRSLSRPCSAIGWASNPLLLVALALTLALQVAAVYWPPMQLLLQTTALGAGVWALILALAVPLVAVPEGIKALRRSRTEAERSAAG